MTYPRVATLQRVGVVLFLVMSTLAVAPGNVLAAEPLVVEAQPQLSSDDAEESSTGSPSLTSSDLELVRDGTRGDQIVGIRFPVLGIPRGARIARAYVQFQVDEATTEVTALTIQGQAIDDAASFTGAGFDISSRTTTVASVAWSPPPWATRGEAGADQQTPDISSVVQEIIDRPGWADGNALAITVTGSGSRVAESFDGDPIGAPLLHVEYVTGVSVTATDDQAAEGAIPLDGGEFMLSRGGPTDQALTVFYTVGGTAVAGEDYAPLPVSGVIPAGETSAAVAVSPLDDVLTEGNETLTVTVTDGPGYEVGTPAAATVTISDDETPSVSVTATDAVGVEGSEPVNEGEFTFSVDAPTDQALTVFYTVEGSATPGSDHVTMAGSVLIPAGQSSATEPLTPVDDIDTEGPETVAVTVVDGSGYVAGPPQSATVTIVDDDLALDLRVATSSDDAEERSSGDVSLSSGDLELVVDTIEGDQVVGLRFADIPVSQGATITKAYVQFQVNEATSDVSSLTLEGELIDSAPTFTSADFNISSRSRTTTAVAWSPPAWPTTRVAGIDQQTPELSSVIQEIVNLAGWTNGNSLVLIITGTGQRVADSFDGDASAAPILHVEFADGLPPVNQSPSVEARADSVFFPVSASLDGTVSDDLLPDSPSAVATTWSQVSGPGVVTFGDSTATDTTATFSSPGIYELRLTATDGELSSSDNLVLTAVDPTTPPPDKVRFAAFGDYGRGSSGEAAVASLVANATSDFIITAGDNRYVNDIDWAVGQFYADYIADYSGSYGPGAPLNRFFPALGNHDYHELGGVDLYLDYFSLPGGGIPSSETSGNERYYDVVQGPVHLFVINSNTEEPDGRSSTSLQAQWLEAQMAASDSPWKIVYMHHAPYSSGRHGPASIMQWPYAAWGADAVLAGHDHVYERIVKDGFPYFVVGTGGTGLSDFVPPGDPDSQAFYNADHGALLVEACAASLRFDFHSISEGVVDSYVLGAPACNQAPVLDAVGDQTVDELVELSFTATGSDVDVPADVLVFSLDLGAPVGAGIDPVTGVFSWTPSEAQGPGTYLVTIRVTDDGVPSLDDFEAITVTVGEVNVVAVADAGADQGVMVGEPVSLDGSGSTDSDVPAQALIYSWVIASVPVGSVATLVGADTVSPLFTPDVGGDYVIELVVNDGIVDSAPDTVTVTAADLPRFIVGATAETTVAGTVASGDMTSTYERDNVYEQLAEERSGGNPANRVSSAEHDWTFDVPVGDSATFNVEAYHSSNTEGDNFMFGYSLDGVSFTDMVEVIKTADDDQLQSYLLPPSVTGTVTVRVSDTDRTTGNGATDDLFVDFMFIEVFGAAPVLPRVTVEATDPDAAETGLDTGTFTVSRVGDTSGDLTVFYTVGGAATAGDDYTPVGLSVAIVAGQASTTITVTPVDDDDQEGDETVTVTVSANAAYNIGTPSGDTVTILDNDGTDAIALSEQTVRGTVTSGTYVETRTSDDVYEAITEEPYGGNQRSRLEQEWTFDLTGAGTWTFHVEAHHSGGADDFVFAYSGDGTTWTEMVTVTESNDDDSTQLFALPGAVNRTVFVHVVDTDRSRGESDVDTVYIDAMYFTTG